MRILLLGIERMYTIKPHNHDLQLMIKDFYFLRYFVGIKVQIFLQKIIKKIPDPFSLFVIAVRSNLSS